MTRVKELIQNGKCKLKRAVLHILCACYSMLIYCQSVYAKGNTTESSGTTGVTNIPGADGTIKMIGDVTSFLQVIAIPVAVLYFIWRNGQLGVTDDQGDETRYKKLRNKTIITVIIIEIAPLIINWFTGYYTMGK